jgi:4-hydroxy-tetrahydrodipicolinate reductase
MHAKESAHPLKIGLLGYGKMGKAIEAAALNQGDCIAWRMNRHDMNRADEALLQQADVILEFTSPESAVSNLQACLKAGVPVVTGTTGWLDELPMIHELVRDTQGALLHASNFSIGVNLFFAINRYMARLMDRYRQYEPHIEETHHIHKKDAPSGTAISIAQGIMDETHDRWAEWKLISHPVGAAEGLAIYAFREGEVPGTHTVIWSGNADRLTLQHEAIDRSGFAWGAHYAARWIIGRKGVFTMEDALGIR